MVIEHQWSIEHQHEQYILHLHPLRRDPHHISRVKDNNEAWSSPVTSNLTITDGSGYQLTLEAAYSTDVKNSGTKYYHDGNDWVGRSTSGSISANRWDISGVDPPGISSPLRYGSTWKQDRVSRNDFHQPLWHIPR